MHMATTGNHFVFSLLLDDTISEDLRLIYSISDIKIKQFFTFFTSSTNCFLNKENIFKVNGSICYFGLQN